MEDEKLSILLSNLELVNLKLRTVMETQDISESVSADLKETYSLILKSMEMLREEEVKNEITGLSHLDE
ncbi:MAG: hypothetical protein JW982_09555 [Spirochaetes bacterium]|nr:hypothetical protein [Spirochaetota bacterium]